MDKEMDNNKQLKTEDELARRSSKRFLLVIIMAVLVAAFFGSIFGFMGGGVVGFIFSKKQSNEVKKMIDSSKEGDIAGQVILNDEERVVGVVEKASPSVISIIISKDVSRFRSSPFDPFGFDSFFDPFGERGDIETEKQRIGGGSGFFVSSDGLIVTNKHVVNDADAEYKVITDEGREFDAEILAIHPTMDVAIMKIEGENFPILELGDSDALKAGQAVIAIGYSLGEFSNSVSMGIVSGLKRDVTAGSGLGDTERLSGIIQTDAAINPGNSGGPLLDIHGKVIGVNVAVAQGAENIGFALPISEIRETIDQVRTSGKISVPFMGVRYIILDAEIQKENDLPFDYGALILRGEARTDFAVIPGSPADKAGLVENDIVLEIEGERVTSENTLGEIVSKYKAGEDISLNIWHKGETKEVRVTLGERNNK